MIPKTTDILRLADEILALNEKATDGPWQSSEGGVYYGKHKHGLREHMLCEMAGLTFTPKQQADATFVARTRTLAPALAMAVKEMVDCVEYVTQYDCDDLDICHEATHADPSRWCFTCRARALLMRLRGTNNNEC